MTRIILTATLRELERLNTTKIAGKFSFRRTGETLIAAVPGDVVYVMESFATIQQSELQTKIYYRADPDAYPQLPSGKTTWLPASLMTYQDARFVLDIEKKSYEVAQDMVEIGCALAARHESGRVINTVAPVTALGDPTKRPSSAIEGVVVQDPYDRTVPLVHDNATQAKPYLVTTRECRNCDYWFPYDHLDATYGQCRRYPPRVLANNKQTGGADTTHDFWCGEFEGKKS